MNIHHLKYFYDSARLGSVSGAAEVNHVGQPAISKAIQSLEGSLDVKLILHEKKRFNLTDEGAKAFELCQEVFRSVEKFKDSVNQNAEIKGEVRFACQSSMGESLFLSRAIKNLSAQFPNLNLNLSLGRTDLVAKWLQDGIIDFAIAINNRSFRAFNIRHIGKGTFNLVKSQSYKSNWREEGILMTEPTKELEDLCLSFRNKNDIKLKGKMTIGSWGVIKNFALQGLGVGFVPDYLIKKELESGDLKIVDKKNYSIPYEIILLTPKRKYISAKVNAAIEEFVEGGC